jgi:hypothetical protein
MSVVRSPRKQRAQRTITRRGLPSTMPRVGLQRCSGHGRGPQRTSRMGPRDAGGLPAGPAAADRGRADDYRPLMRWKRLAIVARPTRSWRAGMHRPTHTRRPLRFSAVARALSSADLCSRRRQPSARDPCSASSARPRRRKTLRTRGRAATPTRAVSTAHPPCGNACAVAADFPPPPRSRLRCTLLACLPNSRHASVLI